jgi:hypothetical protein
MRRRNSSEHPTHDVLFEPALITGTISRLRPHAERNKFCVADVQRAPSAVHTHSARSINREQAVSVQYGIEIVA